MMDSTDIPDDQFDRVMMLRNMIEAHVTGSAGLFTPQIYNDLRQELIQDPNTRDLTPTCVRTCRTEGDIWAYFKSRFGTYAERRSLISEEFEPLFEYLELPNLEPETQPVIDIKAETKMYNLIVTHYREAWNGSPYGMDRGRFGEYTDDSICDQFRDLDDSALERLKSFPTIFAIEGELDTEFRVGRITKLKARPKKVGIFYQIDEALPPITWGQLIALQWELDVSETEMYRTHWAVKEIDLITELLRAGIFEQGQIQASSLFEAGRQQSHTKAVPIEVKPDIFHIPSEPLDPLLVAVMMPFDHAFDDVYRTLETACSEAGLTCLKVSQVWEDSQIIQDIFSLIYRSKIVICDFTGKNTNVFYEAGIAHTLGKPVIPITQHAGDIPFDLAQHRYISYLDNNEGLGDLKSMMLPRLNTLKDR